MVYSYPSTITTSTGRSTKYNTQKLSNKNALCSNSTELAYWGVRKPTWVGNYLRNYPDSLTSRSGSYYTPEVFYASGFTVPNAPDEAIVQTVKVQYAWEQVSYSSKTAFGTFKSPEIKLILNKKTLAKISGKAPDAIRYDNATDSAHKNPDKAELANKRSSSAIDLSSYKITIADLKKLQVRFAGAENTSWNHLRLIMQFIRLDVTYKDIDPTLKITASSTNSVNFEKEYTAQLTVKSTNNRSQATDVTVTFSDAHTSVVKSAVKTGSGTFKKVNGVWTWHISKFNNHKAVLELKLKNYQQTPAIASNKITGTIVKYFDKNGKTASTTTKLNKVATPTANTPAQSVVKNLLFYTNRGSQQVFNENDGIYLNVSLVRNVSSTKGEYIEIDTKGLLTDDNGWSNTDGLTLTHLGDGVWRTSTFNRTEVTLTSKLIALPVGDYYPTVKIVEGSNTLTRDLTLFVLGQGLQKEYFKLRLEDGSDVRYNSLMFTEGDDLTTPLTYIIEDVKNPLIDNIIIAGETKRIPTNEAKFINFDVDIFTESNEMFTNTIFYFEITDSNGNECNDVIIGAEDGIDIYTGTEGKYCIVHELHSNTNNRLKFIALSDTEIECITFKIKPLNQDKYEDGTWKPAKVMFEDMPNIKLGIQGISELNYTNEEEAKFSLIYTLENRSDIDGKDLKFKLTEPPNFKRLRYEFEDENPDNEMSPYFNTNNRIIRFPHFEANSKVYSIKVDYQATYKGIYDFVMRTIDDSTTLEDDLYANSVTHKMLVNIASDIDINTYVSKTNPYLNELFDFKITVKNFHKPQSRFTFNIRDIGQYDINHRASDYVIEYVNCKDGTFVPAEDGNMLGTWTLEDIGVNDEYELVLSLRPTDTGIHAIQTVFYDAYNETQDFENTVKILEPNHKLKFDVHHAVGDADCKHCDDLTIICDDDFISLGDEIYYVFEITNNERNAINDLHAYARLPTSFGDVFCYTPGYQPEQTDNGLLKFTIPSVEMCSSVKFCIKVKPEKEGEFDENFMLSTRNAKVLHKKLHLTIDNDFNERKLQHEINIYNFEKSHRYFRYELDGSGNLFKFFNKGDISKRTVDFDFHKYSAVETYKGNNLKRLVADIKNNSKYVEPELLRIGSNKLATQGHEMYPNGFINRFGLLKSEVHHYTGQFPIITNLVDYAMRWDIDNWDEKVWSGNDYQNGVFDLSIDYAKIPTNFNILELQNPIGNLQVLVDKVKPVGTKAICYYSASVQFELRMNMDLLVSEIGNMFDFDLEFDRLGLISWYSRHDASHAIYYDLTDFALTIDNFDALIDYQYPPDQTDAMETEMTYSMEVYTDEVSKVYIQDCMDIVQNLYEHNQNIRNIVISKPVPTENIIRNRGARKLQEGFIYTIFSDVDCGIRLSNDIYIIREGDTIRCSHGKTINDSIFNVALQVQRVNDVIHIWASKNNESLYHIGYYIIEDDEPIDVEFIGEYDYSLTTNDSPVTFSIDDSVKVIKENFNELKAIDSTYKWDYLNRIGESYAYIENGIDIDVKCKDDYIKTPTLLLRYDSIDIEDEDEIVDIAFDIKAQTNKKSFEDDIDISLYKDGDYYLPRNNISHKNYYPNNITNVNKEYISTLTIQQPNITICSSCLKTSLGYYDKCPYCDSTDISHTDEKQPATICYNCGWIENGWYNRCPHCLSRDIEKVEIDYNKTYCYDCKAIYNDYYTACPHCFSTNIAHLQNDEKTYNIFDSTTQNISPIVIQGDINRVNICNITVPLGEKTQALKKLELFNLGLSIKNNNDGKYYYCPDCEKSGLGNERLCPHCHSEAIINYQLESIDFDAYIDMNGVTSAVGNGKLAYGKNDIKIDILKYARSNKADKFKLMCYVENVKYKANKEKLERVKNFDEIIKANHLDVMIDNIYFESKYLDEKEWEDIDAFEGLNHKGIRYVTSQDGDTDYINFSNFYIDENNIDKLYLHIKGINKSYAHINMNVRILDNQGNSYSTTFHNVSNNMFEVSENIYDLITYKNFDNLSIQLNFLNVKSDKEIIITDCYLTAEKSKFEYELPAPAETNTIISKENNVYHIAEDNMWNLNASKPHYMSGEQIRNGLLCAINFGKLNLQEYIRLYNIDMIVHYKNRHGVFVTNKIPIINLHKTHCFNCGQISDGEHSKCPSCNSSNVMYLDATEDPIQLVSGNINRNNGTNWGAIKTSDLSLNNLEYDINIREDNEKYIDSLPLFNQIAQSFTANNTNIYKIRLNYFGKVGYPSEHITLSLYDDYDNKPHRLIAQHEIDMPNGVSDVDESFYVDGLNIDEQYWIVLEDKNSNENNYHRFRYNNNIEIGSLIYEIDGVETYDENMALSFAVDTGYNIAEYQSLPISWSIDNDSNSDFKIHNELYRYNVQSTSNVQIRNLSIKSGYVYNDDAYIIEEDDENEL